MTLVVYALSSSLMEKCMLFLQVCHHGILRVIKQFSMCSILAWHLQAWCSFMVLIVFKRHGHNFKNKMSTFV